MAPCVLQCGVTDVFLHTLNCMIGIGLLALPHAVAVVGPVVFVCVLLFVAAAAIVSTHMLTACLRTHRGNLEDICAAMFGRGGYWIMCAVIVLENLGSVCSYMHMLMSVLAVLVPDISMYYAIGMLILFVLFPVSLPKSSRCLMIISGPALMCVLAFVVYTIYYCVHATAPGTAWPLFDARMRVDQCLSIITFAFVCQPTIVTTANLHGDKVSGAAAAAMCAMSVGTVLYAVIALCGWLPMGPETPDNIVLAYMNTLDGKIVAGVMCVSVVLTVPALLLPVVHMMAPVDRSPMQWISTLVMYVCMYVLVIMIPSFKVGVVVVGAVAGTVLVFTLPVLMYTWLFYRRNVLAWMVVVLYTSIGIAVSVMAIYDIKLQLQGY
ncbi:transmembrane amino acid transporter [Turbot reddish body iridovirus]|uniref:Transmembrane amino acid transporter n=1 Tax=Turbot reddish body iridovirus TaxID=273651 RepID=E2CTU6_ISKNV|nr:transmembrane amino acid transporter [Turbot reddish body iridovirus]